MSISLAQYPTFRNSSGDSEIKSKGFNAVYDTGANSQHHIFEDTG